MTASRILSEKGSQVHSLDPGHTLLEAAEALQRHRIGALVVVDRDRRPVGVFSERDLVTSVSIGGPAALAQPVSAAMSTKLVTAQPGTPIDILMGLMTDKRVRHILIMEGEDLAGVVSIGDVVKRKIALAEAEADSLKSYIEGA